MDYLFSRAFTINIGVQPAGDPDSDGDGLGVEIYHTSFDRMYETGVAAMAIAHSTHPEMVVDVPGSDVDCWTYEDVLVDVVDYIAWGQQDSGLGRGGWRYYENYGSSDNSVSGYAVLGLVYANATPPIGFGLPIPAFVKSELDIWIDYIQNDVGVRDPTVDGGSGYASPDSWVNILKTGNLLQEMAFVGDTLATQRVQDAIDYIERHWDDEDPDPGWRGYAWDVAHKQAMFTTMKGFEAFNIGNITVDRGGPTVVDWFDEMATVLLDQQNPDGSWDWDEWGDNILGTTWALLTLERAAPPVAKYDLTVHVVDATTGDPISGALVTASGPDPRSDITDGTGTVVFLDILAGDYDVSASKTGYDTASVMVEITEDTEIWIRLVPSVAPPPVGGLEAPINTLVLLAPWIILALATSFGAVLAAKRKRKH